MKPSDTRKPHKPHNKALDLPEECQPIQVTKRDIVEAFENRGGPWWADNVRLTHSITQVGYKAFDLYVDALKAAMHVTPTRAPDLQLTELADNCAELEVAGTTTYVFSLTKLDTPARFYLVFKTPTNTWCIGMPSRHMPPKVMAEKLADITNLVVELVNKDR